MEKVIVFDLDGTLVDSKKLYTESIHHSLLEHYFTFPKSHVSRALGPKLEITLRNIGKFQPETLRELKDSINKEVSHSTSHLKLCPGAKEALKKLKKKNYTIALMTNSAREFAVNALRTHKIRKYFTRLFYAENFSSKEDALRAIARKYNARISDVVYVADKKADVKIARNAGCRIIVPLACSWDKRLFKGEKYTIRSLKKLEV